MDGRYSMKRLYPRARIWNVGNALEMRANCWGNRFDQQAFFRRVFSFGGTNEDGRIFRAVRDIGRIADAEKRK